MGLRHPHKPSEYPSIWLYILDETHITVTVATAIVLVYTRSPHVAWFATGALGASQIAKGIKLLLRRPRPPPPPPSSSKPSRIRPKKTYGMPSTHSTALTFYMAYILPLLPSLFASYTPSGISTSASLALSRIGLVGSWGAGLWSRQALGYHTTPQILVGGLLGAVMAVGWSGLWVMGKERGWGIEEGLGRLMEGVWGMTVGRILG